MDISTILKNVVKAFPSDVSTADHKPATKWVTTGSTLLDAAICKNGLPYGKVIELIGKSATGKSAIGFSIIAQVQKEGGIGILLDSECAVDLDFAEKFGVDRSKVIIAYPSKVEEVYQMAKDIVTKIRENDETIPVVIVADSCTVPPQEESVKKMAEPQKMGENAKVQRRGLRGLLNFLQENEVMFIGVNHVTANIGAMYGPKEVSTGGSAWEFFPSVRIKLHKASKIENKTTNTVTGMQVHALIIKNRFDFPYRSALLVLDFNKGFDDIGSLIEYAKETGIIGKKGGWLTYNGESYRRDDLEQYLLSEDSILSAFKTKCIDTLKSSDKAVANDEAVYLEE